MELLSGFSGGVARSARFAIYAVISSSYALAGCPSESTGGGERPRQGGGHAGTGTAGGGAGTGASVIPGGQTEQPPPSGGGAGTGAAGTGPVGEECAAITESAEVERGPVDIVWIIDGSGSMLDEIIAVQDNITNFANMISNAGIDHHVIMLATDNVAGMTPLGMDAAHYLYVPALVDSHNALQLLLDQYSQYSSFLRPEAPLHFVLVSDDESALDAASFQMQMEAAAGKKFTFHAIASEADANGLPCVGACGLPLICGGFAPGVQYYALADATGGQKISICIADWSMVFGPLQEAVIASAPLPCDYAIPPPPDNETLDPDKVNLEYLAPGAAQSQVFPRAAGESACAQSLAWFYDDPAAPTQIRMCPAACSAIGGGGTVQIKLGCETVLVE
jgi:hypothetical protein